MASITGSYFRLLHQLRRHMWLEIPLFTWMIILLVVLISLILFGLLPGGLWLAVLALAVVLFLTVSARFAKRRSYIVFETNDAGTDEEAQPPLWPGDKLQLHASGQFEVEGQRGSFTNLIAYYRTFETREHAILARNTPSRYVRIGRSDSEKLGMWYIFIRPEQLVNVQAGTQYFGSQPQPGLRLDYVRLNEKGKPVKEVAYLCFKTDSDRARVSADLMLDIGGPARIPWKASAQVL